MEDFRRGDQPSFKKVYEYFYRPLFYFASQIVVDEPEAQDIVSETFRKLWQLHENFESLVNIKAFLYITTRNNCFNFLKSGQRDRSKQLSYSLSQVKNEEAVINSIIKTELLEEIRREIEELPEQQRIIFKLFYLESLSMDEIATRLNLRSGTVRMNKLRALKHLRNVVVKKKLLPAILFLLYLKGAILG
jgi:RNA polymerase sigma-70 factor (ECF subfamily)